MKENSEKSLPLLRNNFGMFYFYSFLFWLINTQREQISEILISVPLLKEYSSQKIMYILFLILWHGVAACMQDIKLGAKIPFPRAGHSLLSSLFAIR
jgi:hypothetical protein